MKSTITRERLQEITEDGFLKHGESKELARMALSAMDSEPVVWLNGCNKSVPAALRYLAENPRPIGGESSFNAAHLYQLAREIELMAEGTLYRHAQPAQTGVDDDVRSIIGLLEANEWAEHCTETVLGSRLEAEITRLVGCVQPAPVAPEEMPCGGAADDYNDGYQDGWNACRAAMLQAEPVTTANKLGNSSEQGESRCGTKGSPALDPSSKNAESRCGNSPVIPDTWIPVSERMPENDVSVLTFDGMYKRVHHAMYGHWQCWEPEKITHWMPLPSAPQEVKGE